MIYGLEWTMAGLMKAPQWDDSILLNTIWMYLARTHSGPHNGTDTFCYVRLGCIGSFSYLHVVFIRHMKRITENGFDTQEIQRIFDAIEAKIVTLGGSFFVLEMHEIIIYSFVASNEYQPADVNLLITVLLCGACLFVGI